MSGQDGCEALGVWRGYVPVAETTRSGAVESVHLGAVSVVDAAGTVVWSLGEPGPIYARSANKPIQAQAMELHGLRLNDRQWALACASHAGTPAHCEVVRSTLAAHGCSPNDLGNTPDLPLDEAAARAVIGAGGSSSALLMNCSGKHAAMLATCVVNGWDRAGYLDAAHPLQQAITEHVAAMAGGVAHIGVDGCGAPAHMETLAGLANAFGKLAGAGSTSWRAMTAHPELVGGERRDVTRLMRAQPGMIAKEGAEGVFAVGLPDGRGVAVKVADGAGRAAGVVLAAVLRSIGVDLPSDVCRSPILGHGRRVGEVRPVVGQL